MFHFLLGELKQVTSIEEDLSPRDARRARKQSQNRKTGHGLPAACLADQAEDLAFPHLERNPQQSLVHAPAGAEFEAQVTDFE